MASSLNLTQSSLFFGSPTIAQVTSVATPTGASFHRVKLYISITDGTSIYTTELSAPVSVSNGQTVQFDLSSAFQSAADAYEYSPVTAQTTFPAYTATFYAADTYVLDSDLKVTGQTDRKTHTAIAGSFSDYERRKGTLTASYSRKPTTTPEIMFVGDTIVYAGCDNSAATKPTSFIKTLESADNGETITLSSGSKVYVTDKQRNSALFQFVNSRGCIETIRLFGLAKESVSGETADHVISRFETLTTFSRTITRKYAQQFKFTMSTGPIDIEWARWFAGEFCASEHHWMYTSDNFWLPVRVTLSDGATLIDRSKTELLSLDLTIKPDISGPLF